MDPMWDVILCMPLQNAMITIMCSALSTAPVQ
jgi:hypothetical protein